MSTETTEINALREFTADHNIRIRDEAVALRVWLAASDDGYIQADQAVALFPGQPELHSTMRLATALEHC